jgi:hypothetical protein
LSGLADGLTFARLVDMQFEECICALRVWWLRQESTEGLRVGCSRLSWDPGEQALRSGRCKIAVRLHRGGARRLLPMELQLLPWSSLQGVTFLELVPRRAVRPGSRYYRAGHALIDQVILELRAHGAATPELAEAK